jgi:integrase
MASITMRNGSYRVRISRKGQSTIAKSFKSEHEAKKWVRQVEMQLELGIYQETTSNQPIKNEIQVSEAVERYISSHVIHKLNRKTESGTLRLLANRWADRKLSSITKQDVFLLKEDLLRKGRAASTINHYLNAISKLHQIAINEWGMQLVNPIPGMKRMPEPQGRMKRLIPDAEKVLLNHANNSAFKPLTDIIIFAIETGMRAGEILSIRWEDVDLTGRKVLIRHSKNGESRVVPLTLRAKNTLEQIQLNKNTDLVFPYGGCRVRKHFVKTVTRARAAHDGSQNPFIDLRFHDLRHEALSRLSDAGLNVIELSCISGHKNLGMLKRYTHPSHDAILGKIDAKQPNSCFTL